MFLNKIILKLASMVFNSIMTISDCFKLRLYKIYILKYIGNLPSKMFLFKRKLPMDLGM